MDPLDKYPLLPVIVIKSYFPRGISVPVPLILVYFAGLVELAPEDSSLQLRIVLRRNYYRSGGFY